MSTVAEPSLLVVVPTLNTHHLLPRLLASLQQQSWPHWRLVFIDGPSCADHRQWLHQCCLAEPRCTWQQQDPAEPGIYGAMNQGFALAHSEDWLLFWGSDDWAASDLVFAALVQVIKDNQFSMITPDLIVCKGRYAHNATRQLCRSTVFQPAGLYRRPAYRRALLLGSTPPHQATVFGPGARRCLARYADGFRLSADLHYFLQISASTDLQVQVLDLELVHMAQGGISAQQTKHRLQEVRRAYGRAFGVLWWVPFIARYSRRLLSLASSQVSMSVS